MFAIDCKKEKTMVQIQLVISLIEWERMLEIAI